MRRLLRRRLLTQPLNSAAVGDVCHQPRVSFDPPGCGSGMRVPVLPEPCCHHGAQVGRLPCSLSGFPAVPLQRLSMLLHKFDRQVTFLPAFLPGHGWQTPQQFQTRKDTKEAALDACSHPFRVFQNSRLFNSHRLFGLKKLCVGTNGYSSPLVHIQHTEKLGSQLSKSHRRESHL